MPATPSSNVADALARMEHLAKGGPAASTPPNAGTKGGPRAVPAGYFALTRTATYGFLAALPLFVLYEVLVRVTDGGTGVRVGADVWVKALLAQAGVAGTLPLAIAVVVFGVALVLVERRRYGPLPVRASYVGGIVGEGLVYAVVVAVAVSSAVGALFAFGAPLGAEGGAAVAAQAGGYAPGTASGLVLSLGAGLYEEFVFRVILVGGLAWLGRLVMRKRGAAYAVAAVVGALVFSAVHYIGPLGDAFALPSFTFRFLFGLALNALYLTRGFGVAAWAHALYDVLVTLHIFG